MYSVIPKPVNKNVVLHTLARALRQVYGDPPGRPAGPDALMFPTEVPAPN